MRGKIRCSIDKSVIFRSFVLVFIVFSISFFIMYQQTAKKFQVDTTKEICLKSKLVNKDIANVFQNNKTIAKIIAANEDVRQYLSDVKTRKEITTNVLYPKVMKTFRNIIELNDNIYTIWVANEEANFLIDAYHNVDLKGFDIYSRSWKDVAAMSDDVILTEPYTLYGSSKKVLSAVTILREENKIIGYVGIDILIENLPNIMKKHIIREEGMNFIVSNKDNFIYSHVDDSYEDKLFQDLLIEKIRLIEEDNENLQEISYKNRTYYLHYNQMDINDWGIIQLIAKDEMTNDFHDFLRIIWIIFMVIAILLLAIIIIETISHKLLENRLKIQARIDSLTGSNNRSYFMELATDGFYKAKKHQHNYNVLMIDIDYFKSVNDNYGHHVGDIVLENMARLSVHTLGEKAIFGRLGGEEFAAIILDRDEKDALLAAEELRKKISDMDIITERGNININVSIGIAWMNEEDKVLDDLLKRADEAMYEAKRAGRNKVIIK